MGRLQDERIVAITRGKYIIYARPAWEKKTATTTDAVGKDRPERLQLVFERQASTQTAQGRMHGKKNLYPENCQNWTEQQMQNILLIY